jgi:hypothetical protein
VKKLLIIGLLLTFSLKCFSTCIVIYIASNGHIYVAADSKRTFYFADSLQSETVCKIHRVGASYFAISGIDDAGLLKGANKALTENSNIDSAIHAFGEAMVIHYNRLMTDMISYYPERVPHFLDDGLAQVSFFGFYNGKPRVTNIEFECRLGVNGTVITSYRVKEIKEITVIGISGDIVNASYKDMPSGYTREHNAPLYVQKLVEIEIKSQPQAVGGPVDVLELQPGRGVWINKNETAAMY